MNKLRYDLELHRVAHMGRDERVERQGNHLVVRKRKGFNPLEWLWGDAHLGDCFEALRSFLAIQGGNQDGLGVQLVIEDLAALRTKIREMKQFYDRRHGAIYRYLFDPTLDTQFRALLHQIDYTMAKVAHRELKSLKERGRLALEGLRKEVLEPWEMVVSGDFGHVEGALQELWRRHMDSLRGDSKALIGEVWALVARALEEGRQVGFMMGQEGGGQWFQDGEKASVLHSEILSRLSLWRSLVRAEKQGAFSLLQEAHIRRREALKAAQADYDRRKVDGEGPELEQVYGALVEREKAFLALLENLQQRLTQLFDELRDGIKRVGHCLMTDQYLQAELNGQWAL